MAAWKVATASAVGAVLAWALKAASIAVAGGLDRSPLEGPLFFVGLVLILISYLATGVAVTVGRGTLVRVIGGVAGAVVGMALFLIVETVAGALVPDAAGWVQEEAGLWAASFLTAAVLVGWLARKREQQGNLVS